MSNLLLEDEGYDKNDEIPLTKVNERVSGCLEVLLREVTDWDEGGLLKSEGRLPTVCLYPSEVSGVTHLDSATAGGTVLQILPPAWIRVWRVTDP